MKDLSSQIDKIHYGMFYFMMNEIQKKMVFELLAGRFHPRRIHYRIYQQLLEDIS